MARFDSSIALAKRLIEKNGETATLRRPVDGTPPDAAKPWEPGAPTNLDASVSAVFLGQEAARVFGVTLKEGEQMVLVPSSDLATAGSDSGRFVPDPSTDKVVRASGELWTIVTSKPLDPNGQRILETLVVRR